MTKFPAERRREIERLVNSEGSMSISELSGIFKVSEMTIHRDLKTLEMIGAVEKTRGGAIAAGPYVVPLKYRKRLKSNEDLKDDIGRKAVEFIKDGDLIFLGPGTTSLGVARNLKGFENLTVFTNGPAIVIELSKKKGIELHCTGGTLSKSTMAYEGPETERIISKLIPDKCFVGAYAFNIAKGVTDPMLLAASSKRRIVEVSQEVYILATPDKFGNVVPHLSVPLEAIDVVITNENAPENFVKELLSRKIQCVLAPSAKELKT